MKNTDPHVDLYRANPHNAAAISAFLAVADTGYINTPFGVEPWSVDGLVHGLIPAARHGDGQVASVAVLYANVQCARGEWPLWKVSREVAEALLRTEAAPWSVEPLPYPGMYVEIPKGLWQVFNNQTGLHDIVGVYLAETKMMDKALRQWVPATLMLGVGEVRGITQLTMDDAIVFSQLGPAGPDLGHLPEWPAGALETWTFVRNFLYALRTRNLSVRDVAPKIPKSRKKLVRAERQGRTRSYSVVEITSRPVREHAPPPASKGGSGRSPKPHVRRAHFRHTWTLEAEPGHVGCREREGKPPLYRVARWIHMTKVGAGEVVRPAVHVR